MKIIVKDELFVQMCDLDDLALFDSKDMPESILKKIVESHEVYNKGKYDYVCFKGKDASYIKNKDWIIDFNDIKDKSYEDLIKMAEDIRREAEDLRCKLEIKRALDTTFYDFLPPIKLIEEYSENINKINNGLNLKLNSLKNYMSFYLEYKKEDNINHKKLSIVKIKPKKLPIIREKNDENN